MKSELLKRILSSIFLIPLVVFIVIKGSYLFIIFLIICFFTAAYEWYQINNSNSYRLIGIIFLMFSFFSVYQIRFSFDGEYKIFFFILAICVSTDIGGFIFGKLFKGPKLTKISPNKTYAGVFGSYIFSILTIFIILNTSNNFNLIGITSLSFLFIIIISTLSQIGDLIISYFKRKSNIKNTGVIIPGHAGILDRIDGMIFVFTFCYLLILFGLFI